MSIEARTEDRVRPWEMSWNGRHWWDMPGDDHDLKKMNFYLFRMGKLKVEDSQFLNEDGSVRLKLVVAVSFGRMGMALALERQAQRRQRECEVAAERATRSVVDEVWKAGLREQLTTLKTAQHGALRQLAASTGVNYDNLLKFVREGSKLGTVKLRLVEERLKALAAGAFELKAPVRSVVPVETPEGHVPFRAWVTAMAAVRGLKPHSFYAWLNRNPQAMPTVTKVHGRAWFVAVSLMPAKMDTTKTDAAQRVPTLEVAA